MLELNSYIFGIFHNFSNVSGIGLIADFPIFFIPLFLSGLWLYNTFIHKSRDKRIELLHIFYACVIGIIFSYIIKQFIDIERPESYLEQSANLIMHKIPEKSFPSDHATVSFAFSTALFFTGFRKIGYVFIVFATCMNLSRIVVGVHWPADILAGILTGVMASYLFFKYMEKGKLVKSLDIFIIEMMKKLKLY